MAEHGGSGRNQGRHKKDCQCEKCIEKHGSRPVNGNVARKIKERVRAEDTWVALIETEKHRLRLDLPVDERPHNVSVIPLANMLKYQDDRDLGKPMDTVNHLHDEPIEMNVKVKLSEIIRQVRERKREYERSRG